MIIELITKLLSFVTDKIFSVIDFPIVPSGLINAVNTMFDYIEEGIGIINFFCPLDKISPAIDLFLAVWAVIHIYDIVMWILRKIPVLGID